jgi:hypothetical protein
MKCRDAALNAAKAHKTEKQFHAMNLEDATTLGYSLLTPKLADGLDDGMDKAFWEKVLEPAKSAEATWIKTLFPESDPNLSPKHPGASPLSREYSSPYGPMGEPSDDKQDAEHLQDGADHPDFNGWKCYYLPKPCRSKAKVRAESHMQEVLVKSQKQKENLREFQAALLKDPANLMQGSGNMAAAEFWAKSSTPVVQDNYTAGGVGVLGLTPPRSPTMLSNPETEPRIKDWYAQCEKLPVILPIATQNLRPWSKESFSHELQRAGIHGETYIHEPNGRWLECTGGYDMAASNDGQSNMVLQRVLGSARSMTRRNPCLVLQSKSSRPLQPQTRTMHIQNH